MKRQILTALALSVATATSVAAQDMIKATDPLGMAIALRDLGYKATLDKDTLGDPMIVSKAQGLNFVILFYDCTDNADCRSIQYSSSFTLTDGIDPNTLNAWNLDKRYAKTYINDEGEIYLKYDVNLDGGGIQLETFKDNFDIWDSLLGEFKDHIDF